MESFERTAEQYTPMIHKIIGTLNIYKNKDEFFQTGLIALWEAYMLFDETKGSFTNYAYSYVKGKIMTELTKARKQEERSVYPEEIYWETIEESQAIEPFEADSLCSLCTNLTEKETKWLLYTCLNDFTIRDIAEREHVTASAIKQWRGNAKKKLKDPRKHKLGANAGTVLLLSKHQNCPHVPPYSRSRLIISDVTCWLQSYIGNRIDQRWHFWNIGGT